MTGNDAEFEANLVEATTEPVPIVVGNYTIQSTVLGVGNFATVRLGLHIPTGEKVALKLINKKSLLPEDLRKVHREIAISQALRHPHVIRTYQTVENGDHIAVVMEYAAGGEMYAELTKRRKYDEPEARRLFRQIVAAVRYCHSLGIVHRDLKTENLLLDSQNNVKLADFGFSDVIKPGECLHAEWCGSLPYAAPELFQGHSYDGFRSDAWSLGVVLYVMVTGALPFGGDNLGETREQILSGCFTVPSFVSDECAALLRSLLVVDPARRCDLSNVMMHRWFLNCEHSQGPPLDEETLLDDSAMDDSELNEYVLDEMEKLGHHRDMVGLMVRTAPSHDTSVTYHLLNDRFHRNLATSNCLPFLPPPIPIVSPSPSALSSRRSSILTGIVVRDSNSPSPCGSPSSRRYSRRSSLPPTVSGKPGTQGLSGSQSWPVNYTISRFAGKEHRRASEGTVTIPQWMQKRNDSVVSNRSFNSSLDMSLSKVLGSLSMEDINSDEEPDMEAVQRYLSVRGKAMRHTVASGKRASTSSSGTLHIASDPRISGPATPRRHSDNPSRGRARLLGHSPFVRPVSPMDEMAHIQRHLDSGLGSPSYCFSPTTMSPQRQSLVNATSPKLLAVPSAGTFPARLNAAFQSPSFLDKLYGGIRIKVTPHEFEFPDPEQRHDSSNSG